MLSTILYSANILSFKNEGKIVYDQQFYTKEILRRSTYERNIYYNIRYQSGSMKGVKQLIKIFLPFLTTW